MKVRAATQQDSAAIAAFWNPLILETTVTFSSSVKSPDEVAQMIAVRPCFFVFEIGGVVQGFATYDQFRGGTGYAHTMEHTIILAPEASGQGAGRALMQVLMDHARAADIHTLVAGLSGENAAGVAFHRALGFEHVGVLPEAGRKFDRWMDLILMQKRL